MEDNKELIIKAMKAIEILNEFDRPVISKVMAIANQMVDQKKRGANKAGDSDVESWEVKALETSLKDMETLFDQRAYNTNVGRVQVLDIFVQIAETTDNTGGDDIE